MQTSTRILAVDGEQLAGILHLPAKPASRGVVIVVGGPQYRVGSHRQFVLLARQLAAAGFAVLRFDYRGMGDSDGAMRTFEQIDSDLRAAVDALQAAVPVVRAVALWGLCDGASAALLYARQDPRVTGLMLVNPWVRTDGTLARSYVSEYYARRLLEPAFWRKLLRGEVRIGESVVAFLGTLRRALGDSGGQADERAARSAGSPPAALSGGSGIESLPERLRAALAAFPGQTLIILSGRDLTAGEFREAARAPGWQQVLRRPTVAQFTLDAADHTFSRREWRDAVAARCSAWLSGQAGSINH